MAELNTAIRAIEPDAPLAPVMEAVKFEDKDGGLWMSYASYRAMERNIIALREYSARLLLIVEYYKKEGK